jgi:hypothetical protein
MTDRLKCGLGGAATLVLAAVLAKWCVLDVLEAARAHILHLSYWTKPLLLLPALVLAGALSLVVAAKPSMWGPDGDFAPQNEDLIGAFVVGGVGGGVLAGFGLRAWLLTQLEGYGYGS